MGYWCWQHEWNNYVHVEQGVWKKKHKVAERGFWEKEGRVHPLINIIDICEKNMKLKEERQKIDHRDSVEVKLWWKVLWCIYIFRFQIDWFPLRRLDLRRRPSAPDSWYLTASSHEESENFNQFRISHRWGLNSFPPRYVWICNKYDKTKKRHKSNTY